ncbi:MAG: ABC transporter ATP-binding protein [Anaerolineales bacterium]|nr:ABC transporter ATP-binding protein [Anaerolineales bacterium]
MLDVVDVTKSFGAKLAVRGLSLSVAPGEVVAVLGPSGCGKSTVLSLIAGLEKPDSGDVRWAGESLLATPTHQRGFGLMFQDYALFPHRDVFANVAFGLRMQGLASEVIHARVGTALEMIGLTGYDRRAVTTLSGGEQQRVALARALAPRPRVLMLDEPLGALDRALREELLGEIGRILRASEAHPAVLYVTHDQGEAFALADRVAVMRAGQIEQLDEPEALVRSPANAFVADFLGLGTLVTARLNGAGEVQTPWGAWPVGAPKSARGRAGSVLIRVDAAAPDHPDRQGPRVAGLVVERVVQPTGCRVSVELDGASERYVLTLSLSTDVAPQLGAPITLVLDPARLSFVAAAEAASDHRTPSASSPVPGSHVHL